MTYVTHPSLDRKGSFNNGFAGLRDALNRVEPRPAPAPKLVEEPRPAPKKKNWSRERADRVRRIMRRTGRSSSFAYMVERVATSGDVPVLTALIERRISVNRANEIVTNKQRDRKAEKRVQSFRALSQAKQEILLSLV